MAGHPVRYEKVVGMSINRVMITGNLTKDPELKSLPSGSSVLEMRLAVNDRRKNQQSGEWEDYANYVDVILFGQRGESLTRFLSKGSKIAVDGKLRFREWEKDGQKRSKLEVVADDVDFMSGRGEGGGGSSAPRASAAPADADAPAPDVAADLGGEEIPF